MLYIIFKGVIHIDNLYGRINIKINETMNMIIYIQGVPVYPWNYE